MSKKVRKLLTFTSCTSISCSSPSSNTLSRIVRAISLQSQQTLWVIETYIKFKLTKRFFMIFIHKTNNSEEEWCGIFTQLQSIIDTEVNVNFITAYTKTVDNQYQKSYFFPKKWGKTCMWKPEFVGRWIANTILSLNIPCLSCSALKALSTGLV